MCGESTDVHSGEGRVRQQRLLSPAGPSSQPRGHSGAGRTALARSACPGADTRTMGQAGATRSTSTSSIIGKPCAHGALHSASDVLQRVQGGVMRDDCEREASGWCPPLPQRTQVPPLPITFTSFMAWDTLSFVNVRVVAQNKNPNNNNNNFPVEGV